MKVIPHTSPVAPGNRRLPNAAAQSELSVPEQNFSHYTYSTYFLNMCDEA